eukprot:TRINITY_DN8985_c0_g1_i2.p1 TRINITY_DN8985_c0_g1~~TRINITY_DN8985_c0_g1_i2.p1  ORF type:complete len:303 (-),score=28.22 TRINITY_DN8985_c0_g1_i2:307-1215(-)
MLSERIIVDIIRQILNALQFCHANRLLHRDLRPENINIIPRKGSFFVKLSGFGMTIPYNMWPKESRKLTSPFYISPESLHGCYDEKGDIWAVGVMTYILFCGFPPFNGPNDKAILDKISRGYLSFDDDEWTNVSPSAKNLVRKMLESDPVRRPTAAEALGYEWFTQNLNLKEPIPHFKASTLKSLKVFRASQKLERAIWMFIRAKLAAKEEEETLLKIFKSLNKQGDGMLLKEGLIVGCKKLFGSTIPPQDIDYALLTIDIRNGGVFKYVDFVEAILKHRILQSRQMLERTFTQFEKVFLQY